MIKPTLTMHHIYLVSFPDHQVVDGENEAAPRRAKWWYVTFHNVTAMVGAGVLSLPYAMAHLGW
jgi:hypothetical protein